MSELTGLGLGLLYIVVIILLATRMSKYPYELSRSFTQIMIANWWFIAATMMSSYWVVMVTPILLILFTLANTIFNFVPCLNSKLKTNNLGTLFYAFSILFLIHFFFFDPNLKIVAGLGILVMGYGDGFAALIGLTLGKHEYTIFRGHKTLEGSFAMLVVSMVVVYAYLSLTTPVVSWAMVITIPILATLVEAISPYGLDNLFVPLITSLIYFIHIF